MQWPQSLLRFVLWVLVTWVTWLTASWYNWFQRSVLLALGLCYHKGSGGRSLGYDKDKDQVDLVIPDSSGFWTWVLVTLGTPTINHIINVIKESEIDELLIYLNGSRIDQLLACWQAGLWFRGKLSQTKLWIQLTWMRWSKQQRRKKWRFFIQNNTWLNKTSAPGKQHACDDSISERGDGPYLPHGLCVVNTYIEVISGSKWVAVLVQNLLAIPITITKGVKVTQVVAANVVPPVEVTPNTLEKLDEIQGIQWTKMMVEQRKKLLF